MDNYRDERPCLELRRLYLLMKELEDCRCVFEWLLCMAI